MKLYHKIILEDLFRDFQTFYKSVMTGFILANVFAC